MIETLSLTRADVHFVAENLWERGKIEMERYGVTSLDQLVDKLMGMAQEYGYSLYADGRPVAVFGAALANDGWYYTWFIATEDFTKIGKAATKFLRDFTRERVAERPDARLFLWSAVDHPEAARWFQVLGFVPTEQQNCFHGYVYQGKSLTSQAECARIQQAALKHSPC